MTQRLSITAAAREIGISRQGLSKLIKQGKVTPPGEDGLLDLTKTISDYKDNTDPDLRKRNSAQLAQIGKRPTPVAKRQLAQAARAPANHASAARTGENDGAGGSNLTKARTAKVFAEAKMARIKLQQAEGGLVSRSDIEDEAFSIARQVRDTLRALPDRLSIHVPKDAMPDIIDVIDNMLDEMTQGLDRIGKGDEETA